MPNIELKAYCTDPAATREAVQSLGATLTRDHIETDTYYIVASGRLKLRESSVRSARLIGYHREDAALLRQSDFQIAEISAGVPIIKQILNSSLPIKTVVTKHRLTFDMGDWLINLDTLLDRHRFVELEVPYSSEDERRRALEIARSLKQHLGIESRDIVPWSYEQIANMAANAAYWHDQLGSLKGRLFLIDGASATGKSSIIRALRDEHMTHYQYVARCTTREKRSEEILPNEYVYLSQDEFQEQAADGKFLEYKHFLFGMSYGLRWTDIASVLTSDNVRAAYALVNLGNIRHIREYAPDATTILITAPMDQISQRLQSRSAHTDDAIKERLENAKIAVASAHLYDYVVDNRDGNFQQALGQVRHVIENALLLIDEPLAE